MSDAEDLKDLYIEELKDLWSANDQMARTLKRMTLKVTNSKLKVLMTRSQEEIQGHTALLKDLLKGHKEKVEKEHCKGMEGLCTEAIKHTVQEAPEKGPVLDATIIAQYQRMTHYGIAGFGTVAAFAQALKLSDDARALRLSTKELYGGDSFGTLLATTSVNKAAVSP